MNKIKNLTAILACKALIKIGRLMGKKGSSAPGAVAIKIAPDLFSHLAKQVKKDIICVCGTNGKTTTSNLLCDLLEKAGNKVVCNRVGANMLPGVACAFIEKAHLNGKLNADYAVLECDEASLRHIVNHAKATKIVVTNLFRDQLDRYGDIEMTMGYIKEAVEKLENPLLILNGDDPLTTGIGIGKNAMHYGINENCSQNVKELKEGRYCPKCHSELKYSFYHYSQLGSYTCENCDFTRPEPDWCAENISTDASLKFDIKFKNTSKSFDLNYRGFYNIYNILAAFAAYESTGESLDTVENVLKNYKPQIGRMEHFKINGKQVILNLSKNPAGFNQAIATVKEDKREKDIIFILNDMASDGRDISWLWEVDFELLKDAGIQKIYTSGMRKYDMALRLKYAGFEHVCAIEHTKESIENFVNNSDDVCYLLVNYTALFSTQKMLKDMEDEKNEN